MSTYVIPHGWDINLIARQTGASAAQIRKWNPGALTAGKAIHIMDGKGYGNMLNPAVANRFGYQPVDKKPGTWLPKPGAVAAPGGTAAPADVGTTAEGQSAKALIQSTLATYGLPASLADWAWGQYIATGNTDQVFLDLRQRPEYQARFPGMAQMAKEGRAMSEGEYMQAEDSYRAQMRGAGLPQTFYDSPDDFAKLIVGGVSGTEFGERLGMAQQAALTDPRGTILRDELATKYGLPNAQGLVTAYFIDPDKGMDLIKKQYTAAITGTASRQAGFGSLSTAEAERVAGTGITEDAARQTFGSLATMGELQANLPGQGNDAVSRDDLLSAGFENNAISARKIARTQETRVAAGRGGGGFASGQTGVSGLGTSGT